MGEHTSYSLPEDSGRGSVMKETSLGVVVHPFVKIFREFNSVSEKRSRNVNTFSSNNDYLLSVQKFLGNIRSKST